MHAPAVPQGDGGYWGIGWDVGEYNGMPIIARVGDTGNFHGLLVLFPEKERAIVLLANVSGFEHLISQVVGSTGLGIIDMLNGKPAAPASVSLLIHFLYWFLHGCRCCKIWALCLSGKNVNASKYGGAFWWCY